MVDLRRRFWIESALAGAALLLAVVTLLWPDWIELVLGVDPDNGSGALEWIVVGLTTTLALSAGLLARAEWRAHG